MQSTSQRQTAAVLATVCAASAGIHLGLAPQHLNESLQLGCSFIAASALLMGAGAAICLRPASRLAAIVAAVSLGGVIIAYAASRSAGLPIVDPTPEAVDALGVVSVAIELLGIGCALALAGVPSHHYRAITVQPPI